MRLDHVGIVVGDLEAGVRWLRTAFGWTVAWREPDTDVDDVRIGLPDEVVRLRGAMLRTGDGSSVELHQYLSPVGVAVRRVCDRGIGHLAIGTRDIESDHARLRNLGVEWYSEPGTIVGGPLDGRRWVYGLAPVALAGIVLELCQDREVAA